MTVEITAYQRPSQLVSKTGALRLIGPIVALVSRRQARVIWGSLKLALEEQ
jgi:hypothetical protein